MDLLELDDFKRYKFLSGIKFSPNGKKCGFVMHHINIEENKYLSNIYLLDEDNKPIKLTSLDEEKSFIWMDDSRLLFPAIRTKKDRERTEKGEPLSIFYEINLNGGEANKVMELPLNVISIEIVDENTYMITSQFDPNLGDFHTLSKDMQEKKLEDLKDYKNFEVLDEIPFWSNGDSYTNKKRVKLFTYNVREKSLTPITDDFSNVESFAISKDKSSVVFITSSFIDKMSTKTELNLYRFNDNSFDKISPIDNFNYGYCDFWGEKIVFAGNDMSLFGINENSNFYITDNTGSNSNKISDFDASTYNSVGSDCRFGSSRSIKVDGEHLYFTTTEGSSSFINRVDIYGNVVKITKDIGSIDGLDVVDGKIYFIGLRDMKLQEIYSQSNDEAQLTTFNSWIMKEKTLSTPEKLVFAMDNGIEIDGWVLKPTNYEKDKLYPGILNIHGGPKTIYGEVFVHEMQYWANKGYFVFFCNPRGSDGHGNEFADIRGKYGTTDYDDIMDFMDLVLINYPEIDKDRIGVTGGSYGGFMTNWIIGHTSRFRAAASQRSISNWISFFGTSDIGYYFADDQNASTPWSDIDKMWYHSPLKYADKVTTPTLFIHSDEDYRCWIPEGLQMFTALKYHGVESRLVVFKGENHELSRSGKPKSRIKRLEEITAWFDKYLR